MHNNDSSKLNHLLTCFIRIKQSSGAFIAVYRYASATPLPPSILSRGIGWQVRKDGYYFQFKYLQTILFYIFMNNSTSKSLNFLTKKKSLIYNNDDCATCSQAKL